MSISFTICNICGNTEDNHNYRHAFEGTITVKVKNGTFILDAHDFEERTRTCCGVENCDRAENIHGIDIPEAMRSVEDNKNDPRIIKHDYVPRETKYRKILFNLPPSTKCIWTAHEEWEHGKSKCNLILEDHDESESNKHHFTTSVVIKNRSENDEIHILDPDDEDIKIVWENLG